MFAFGYYNTFTGSKIVSFGDQDYHSITGNLMIPLFEEIPPRIPNKICLQYGPTSRTLFDPGKGELIQQLNRLKEISDKEKAIVAARCFLDVEEVELFLVAAEGSELIVDNELLWMYASKEKPVLIAWSNIQSSSLFIYLESSCKSLGIRLHWLQSPPKSIVSSKVIY